MSVRKTQSFDKPSEEEHEIRSVKLPLNGGDKVIAADQKAQEAEIWGMPMTRR